MKKQLLSALLLMSGFVVSLFSSNVNAQTPCKGNLILNEISNGKSGFKEFAEFIVGVGACDTPCASGVVDISRWIIDDNNGIFTDSPAVTGTGLGISNGHLRLSNAAFWKNINAGTILVLFNGADYDTTNTDFVHASDSASTIGYWINPLNASAIWVAVGFSPLVEAKTTTPFVSGSPSSITYCDANLYHVDTFDWQSTVGLNNGKPGDGMQVRCPGCTPGLDASPVFWGGFSYGDTTMHVSSYGFNEGAHFDIPDTNGATHRGFQFAIGADPTQDAAWIMVADTPGAMQVSPGVTNSDDNNDYRDAVAAGIIAYGCCPSAVVDTTPIPGILIVTEITNGPSTGTIGSNGSCEYVELLVAACGGSTADSVDIRGWVIDDNAGNFNSTRACTSSVGITAGHLRLAYNNVWKKVPVGSIIVIFNGTDNCYGFADDSADNNHDSVYYLKPGTNPYLERTTTKPQTSPSFNCAYCTGVYGIGTASTWGSVAGLANDKDAMQVRCPGCHDNSTEPAFYHGFGYASTGFTAITAGANDLGGAVSATTGTGKTFELFQGAGLQVGLNSNWHSLTASTTVPPPTVGHVFFSLRDSVTKGLYHFPCCANLSKTGATPFGNAPAPATISEVKPGSAVMYPNPAGDLLNIDINRTAAFEVTIVDLMGKVVYKNTYAPTQGTTTLKLNMSDLSNGVYIYNITSLGNEESLSGRLMIKK